MPRQAHSDTADAAPTAFNPVHYSRGNVVTRHVIRVFRTARNLSDIMYTVVLLGMRIPKGEGKVYMSRGSPQVY